MLLFQDNDEICIQLGLCNSTNVATVGRVSLMAKPQSPDVSAVAWIMAAIPLGTTVRTDWFAYSSRDVIAECPGATQLIV